MTADLPPLSNELLSAFCDVLEQRLALKALYAYLKSDGDIKLDSLIVREWEQKQGKGTQAIQKLSSLADAYGRRLVLSPGHRDDHHGTTSRSRLVRFYKRFGFVENKGRHKDFALSEGMFRNPQPVTATDIIIDIAVAGAHLQHDDALEETGFWGRAGAGCIFLALKTGKVLLSLRGPRVLEPYTWGNFGGAVDPWEDPQAAALREALEETGQDITANQILPLYVFQDAASGFVYSNFLVIVEEEFTPYVDQAETAGYMWSHLDDLPSPLHFGMRALFSDPASLEQIRTLIRGEHPTFHGLEPETRSCGR